MSDDADASMAALREAWLTSTGDARLDRWKRQSLEMAVNEQPASAMTLAQLKAEGRTELDLHLRGASVVGHETPALGFGRFIARTSLAVKEVAKSVAGIRRLAAQLQILAPAPGSVRVVFRSPQRQEAQSALPGTGTDSLEAIALRRLVALMLQAERTDVENSPIEATLYGLSGDARRSVRSLARSVADAHWSLTGELRRGDGSLTPIQVTPAGAMRLADAAAVKYAEVEHNHVLRGVVDGWVWSEATMTFIPEEGRRFRASVAEQMHAAVAHANDDPRPRVRAVFTVVRTFPPGEFSSVQLSYELTSISTTDVDMELPLS